MHRIKKGVNWSREQMDQLELNKTKATELLRAHDADVVKAMTAWVAVPA